MRSKSWTRDLLELAGLAGIAVAVGFLAGLWWGILVGSAALVLYVNLLDGTPPSAPPDDVL